MTLQHCLADVKCVLFTTQKSIITLTLTFIRKSTALCRRVLPIWRQNYYLRLAAHLVLQRVSPAGEAPGQSHGIAIVKYFSYHHADMN